MSASTLFRPKKLPKHKNSKPDSLSLSCWDKDSLFLNRQTANLKNKFKVTRKYKNQVSNNYKFWGKNKRKSNNFIASSMSSQKKTIYWKRNLKMRFSSMKSMLPLIKIKITTIIISSTIQTIHCQQIMIRFHLTSFLKSKASKKQIQGPIKVSQTVIHVSIFGLWAKTSLQWDWWMRLKTLRYKNTTINTTLSLTTIKPSPISCPFTAVQ